MTETCRAGVFLGDGTFEVREFPMPDVPTGGALARVEAVGLCGSDVAQLHGVRNVPGAMFPVVPGHETVARIERIDPASTLGVRAGDRVAIDEVLSVDPLRVYGVTPMSSTDDVGLWGGYGEYIELFPGTTLHLLESQAPPEQLTVFEPLANAMNWVGAVSPNKDDVVVVLGPGHQGLAVVEALRLSGVASIVVVGTAADELRLSAARALGATHVLRADTDDVTAAVGELTAGVMADIVFEVTPAPPAVQSALELARGGGHVLLAGLKEGKAVDGLVTDLVPLKGLRVTGGSAYTAASMAAAVAAINRGDVRLDELAGEAFTLDELDTAIALLTRKAPNRDAIRVSLVHS
jgi:threonine dehydrogenase-like Zn-dependent dehydrogenase